MRLARRSLELPMHDRGAMRIGCEPKLERFSSLGMNASQTETIDDGKALNHRCQDKRA